MDAITPPAWVRKRDGRLEPFEADKISRALFAASDSLGRPDAFLARELTDGVVHFLGEEADDGAPTTDQIAELVAKVVRELGQPALAAAYADHGAGHERSRPAPTVVGSDAPRAAGRAAGSEVDFRFAAGAPLDEVRSAFLRAYTLNSVFARDLVAAQGDDLLTLTGLESPGELAACVVGPADEAIVPAVAQARRFVGGRIVLDGPEYWLARSGPARAGDARRFARELAAALSLADLRAVVNLNAASAPAWAGDLAGGPLFARQRTPPAAEHLTALADELLRELTAANQVRVAWHLSERDFEIDAAGRLAEVARRAVDGEAVDFVFDRPRRPTALAEGVDRQNPAVLLTVGVHLPRLAEQPGVDGDPARFLKKLGSLARLALSAAAQKREFLRRRERDRPSSDSPPVTGGFILDRARLVVAPVGLDAVTRRLTGGGLCSGKESLDFGKQVVQTLRDVLRRDGGLSRLPTCLDGPEAFRLGGDAPDDVQAAGLTAWDADAAPKSQLRAAGALHAIAEGGTAALLLSEAPRPTAETAADCLRSAWKQSDVNRVRLQHGGGTTQ